MAHSKASNNMNFTRTDADIFYIGHKRRTSFEDEEMTNNDNNDYKALIPTREDKVLHTTKRVRSTLKKEFPISKLLGNLTMRSFHFATILIITLSDIGKRQAYRIDK